jgi:signal transduction histidine kinase
VEHFGGRIWVEDAHDLSGAAICFTLPAVGVVEMPAMAAE